MYAAAWPVTLPDRVVMGGVFKTADRGQTWQRLPFPGNYVYGVTVDPDDPDVVYATAWHHGVFRSPDGGQTWERLGGANFGWPHRVIPPASGTAPGAESRSSGRTSSTCPR